MKKAYQEMEPMIAVSSYQSDHFRIVAEKRGDSTLGYRVERRRYRHGEDYWVRVGPRWFEIKTAREYRQFVEQQGHTQIEIQVIE